MPQLRSAYRPLLAALPVILFLYLYIPQLIFPAEDAAILFRYSENLADTGVISYNPGGQSVEGATDFLWMILLGAAEWAGLSAYSFSNFLSLFALAGSYLLGYSLLNLGKQKLVYAYFWLFALLLSTQTFAAIQGFSVGFFGFFILLSVYFFQRKRWLSLIISALTLALIRPDGLIIGVPLVIGMLWRESDTKIKKWTSLLLFGIMPGIIYFVWRYHYFGEWFPLPFYVKARGVGEGGLLVPNSVVYLGTYLIRYLLPLLIGIGVGWMQSTPKSTRQWIPVFIGLILSPLLFYSTIELEQNVAHRFTYPILLGSLLLFLGISMNERIRSLIMGLYFLVLAGYFFIYLTRTLTNTYNNVPLIASELSFWPEKRMAVTEAGRLPRSSRWKCMDLWGLNTPALSRRLPQKRDLNLFDPDLIAMDDGEWAIEEMKDSLSLPYFHEKTWDFMIFNTLKFATESGRYEAWNVPFQRTVYDPEAQNDWIDILTDMYTRTLSRHPDERRYRYDVYLLKKDQTDCDSLRNILRKYGAMRDTTLMRIP